MKNGKTLFIIGVVIVAVMIMQGKDGGEKMAGGECYQEFANVATACGGLATGSYSWQSWWPGLEDETRDGDWNTYGKGDDVGFMYIDYNKPAGALSSSLLQLKVGKVTSVTANIPIDIDCWNQNILQFKLGSNIMTYAATYAQCYDGNIWKNIYTIGDNDWIYEEAMLWDIGGELIKFRTSDLTYGSGSTIAFNTACDGSDLNVYDKIGSAGNSGYCPGTLLIVNLPGQAHTSQCISTTNLYDYSGEYRVCCDASWQGAPFKYYKRYSQTPIGTETSYSTNPSNEVTCAVSGNLVAYYDFQGGNAIDQSGYGNYGIVTGATLTAGVLGDGLSFDGINDYIDAGSDSSLDISTGTLSLWFKMDNPEPLFRVMIAKDVSGLNNGDFSLGVQQSTDGTNPNKIQAYSDSGSDNFIFSDSAISFGEWIHVVYIFGSGGMKMYVNGIQQSSTNANTVGLENVVADLIIGARRATVQNFNGIIDEVKLWNYALSDSEVLAEFNAVSPPGTCTEADIDCDGTIILQEILNAISNVYGDTTYFSSGTFSSANIGRAITGYYGAIIS